MLQTSSQEAQQAWPVFHVCGSYSNTTSGLHLVTSNPVAGTALILDTIDVVDFDLLEGTHFSIAVGDSGSSSSLTYFFAGFTYASSQGVYPWRGQMPLNGTQGLWLENETGAVSLTFHGLLVPESASDQITQFP